MSILVLSGMIASGKSSYSKLLGDALGTEVFFEKVEDNEILPLFYTASKEEQERKRYPFLLQLEFLNSRFNDIKRALYHRNNVLDRSIYEDKYFAKVNNDIGNISDTEFSVYSKLFDNMLEELDELPKKAPDLMIYLHGSFETIMYRIGLRGRDFEQDTSLIDYYRRLWQGYDEWVDKHYTASQVLKINIDDYDVVNNAEDAEAVVEMVKNKLVELRGTV